MAIIKFECAKCHTVYKMDESKIPNKTSKAKCKKCGEFIIINSNKIQAESIRAKIQSYFRNKQGQISGFRKFIYNTLKVTAVLFLSIYCCKFIFPKPINTYMAITSVLFLLNWKVYYELKESPNQLSVIFIHRWKRLTLPLIIFYVLLSIGTSSDESKMRTPTKNKVDNIPGLSDSKLISLCEESCSKIYPSSSSSEYRECVYCCTHECN